MTVRPVPLCRVLAACRRLCVGAVLGLPGVGAAHAGGDPAAVAFAAHAAYLVRQAVAFEHGEGVAREPLRAAAMYCEAARLGNAEGMYALGWMHANGRGVGRNEAQAATLFAMAAFLGHAQAARMLRYTGDRPGEVPECLQPPSALEPTHVWGDERDGWDAERFLARLQAPRQAVARMVAELAPQYGLSPRLALAVAQAESAFDVQALSAKNAMGVMQLIPATAERFAVHRPWDAEQNIRGGLRYLRWLLAYFRGDVALAVAAYNAGEGAVDRYRGVPPYPETRRYVDRVLERLPQARHPFDETLVAPSPTIVASQKESGT